MSQKEPDQLWWTAVEIAEADLPRLPSTTQRVTSLARREGWRGLGDLARRRRGRGGGWEYHWSLFPDEAKRSLLAASKVVATPRSADAAEAWAWFDELPGKTKREAQSRHDCLSKISALVATGQDKTLAVHQIAKLDGLAPRTIWSWFDAVEGIHQNDWLPYLTPRHDRKGVATKKAEMSEEFWDFLKSDFLRFEGPGFSSCYRRAVRVAAQNGWVTVSEQTARRRLKAEVPRATQILARKGEDALKLLYPAQRRDKSALHALEAVNADYHRFDVFVRWPADAGAPEGEIVRAQMVAFQDIFSGAILSWRVDKTPNKVGVSLALGDMIENYGIPEHVLFDNGREFANKFLTGGVKTRFRFKVKDDDIPGILVTLGCKVHWATPYSGQSKPIERAFRDMCDDIARDPRLAGAYTGNRPDAKPENYGERAVDLAEFLTVLEEGITEHNTRTGRRSEIAAGRSLIETFNDSYSTAPIRRATEAQRRLWLMGAEGLVCRQNSGAIHFMGNVYHEAWMHELAGQKVVARFDPADLQAGLMIYAMDGRFIGQVSCLEKAGFFSLEDARLHAAATSKVRKAERAALKAHRKLTAAELGQQLNDAAPKDVAPIVEAKVVRPIIPRREAPAPEPMDPELAEIQARTIASLEDARNAKAGAAQRDHETARGKFRAVLEIDARREAGEPVSEEQIAWADRWKRSAEYQAEKMLFDQMGTAIFGE